MKLLRELALITLIFVTTIPVAKGQTGVFAGGISCAALLKGNISDSVRSFILGMWSGLNIGTERQVGSNSDADGVVGEVRLVCSRRPSMNMAHAIIEAYQTVAREMPR